MAEQFYLQSIIRGRSASIISSEAKARYCHLGNAQPLLLNRQPGNPVDPSAVLITDLLGGPCGYVAREDAPLAAGKLDAGEILLCRTAGPCLCVMRYIIIWSEGEEVVEVEARFKIKGKRKTRPREKVLEPISPNDPGSDGWGS